MKGVRQPWMMRAAIVMIVIGLTIVAWTVLVMWVYREVRPIAPDWLLRERRGMSNLDKIAFAGWLWIGAVWVVVVWAICKRVFRIPDDAIWAAPEPENYPFHKRRLSHRARTQAGQEGYMDEVARRLDAFAKSPLTPPVRRRR